MPDVKTNSLSAINEFLAQSHIAIAGVSRKSSKFGNMIADELLKRGKKIYPVHPNMPEYKGIPCYQEIHELPESVEALVICVKPENAVKLLPEVKEKNIRHIWLQQGSEDNEVIEFLKDKQFNAMVGQCILMFLNPKGIHGFHAFLLRLFGKYPK